MLFRTSTPHAPWTVVESNSKRFARVRVLQTVCDAIAAALPDD
jgi:polyphosphate kinase 2 (PPK2 family)